MGSLAAQEPIGLESSRFLSKTFVPKTINALLEEAAKTRDRSSKATKLDGYIALLEDEMKKIDAFRRELPLCMLLLNDAIVMLKDELVKCEKLNPEPLLEELIPMKKRSYEKDEKLENDVREKMKWMSSVQLWNSADNVTKEKQKEKTESSNGAFVPFKKHELPVILPRLSLSMPETEISVKGFNGNDKFRQKSSFSRLSMNLGEQKKDGKKKRRSWSPELHRRFIGALEHLGGPQVATPKQIRELMQVDGLTNDEVKSHLQKYRLHMRKVHSTNKAPKQINSSSPEGPLHLNGFPNGGDSFEEEDKSESTEV